jgi:site-specific DNA-adenine methylase
MRYQGGKSRIASHIAAKIREMYPTSTEIWEPFCGGGAVTLALAKAGFKVHASDSHEDLILMWQASRGWGCGTMRRWQGDSPQ